MPDTTTRLTPEDLAVISRRCDRGVAWVEDLQALLGEIEALGRENADLRTGSLYKLVASVPSGRLRNRLAGLVAEIELPRTKESGGTDG